jgi:hypothetical protein
MKKIVNRSRFTGYKGMSRIASNINTKAEAAPVKKVTDYNGVEHNVTDLQDSYRNFPSYARKAIDGDGEPALLDCVFRESECGCKIIGNGSLQFPLMIQHCEKHKENAQSQPPATPNVLVIVKGGLVTGAWADDPKTNLEIIDFDNEPGEDYDDEDKRIEQESKGMTPIY